MKTTIFATALLLISQVNANITQMPSALDFAESEVQAIILENGFECDTSQNFVVGRDYQQIDLTDGCKNNVCGSNPKYGAPNNDAKAREYCEA